MLGNETPVVAFPMFEIVEVKFRGTPIVAVVWIGDEAVKSITGAGATVTLTQPLQLLPSLASVTLPTMEVLLSAQALTERVPAVPVKV
jgi:hypothetical protein